MVLRQQDENLKEGTYREHNHKLAHDSRSAGLWSRSFPSRLENINGFKGCGGGDLSTVHYLIIGLYCLSSLLVGSVGSPSHIIKRLSEGQNRVLHWNACWF